MTKATIHANPEAPALGALLPLYSVLSRAVAASAVALMSGIALAQPTVALDVPYVPTPQAVVDRMLQIAEVKPADYVIDVGCGDGRMVVAAAKDYGARGLCNDIDPVRINEAKQNAKQAGVTDKVEFRQGDLFKVDISKADVLPMYLLESINLKLRPKILSEAKPGTRVVSHAFSMGDWKPDLKESVEGRTVYLWVVPAQVDGRWRVQQGQKGDPIDLSLKQDFQEFTGKATINGKAVPIRDGRIRGKEISFTLESEPGQSRTFRGRVNGRAIEAIGDSGQEWLAKRQ